MRLSYCARIVGKDKTEVPRRDGKGAVQAWTLFRNHFVNHSGTKLVEDGAGAITKRPLERADYIDLIAVKGYATAYVLKDDSLPKGRSREPNIAGAEHIMVDFDNTASLEELMQHHWWPKVYFAYATPSYGQVQGPLSEQDLLTLPTEQAEAINAQVGQPKRNFRLVFRFSRFVTVEELPLIAAGLMHVFPMADRSCRDLARLMFGSVNARVEHPRRTYELTDDDLTHLMELGAEWEVENKKVVKARIDKLVHTAKTADGQLGYDTDIYLASGERLTVQDILDHKPEGFQEACFSPFRHEANPSAFVKKWEDGGNVFVFDSGSGLQYTWRNEKPAALTLVKKARAPQVEEPEEAAEPRGEVKLPAPREFQAPTPREVRKRELTTHLHQALRAHLPHVVYCTPEGYGKSTTLVNELMRLGKDVLFCCLSHKQVEEKMRDFQLYSPVRVWSRAGLIEHEFGYKPVANQSSDPWTDPGIDVEATIARIVENEKCTPEEAAAVLDEFAWQAAESRESKARLLITTFATGDVLFRMNCGCMDRVIIVDDPSVSDLIQHEVDDEDLNSIKRQRPIQDLIFGVEYPFQDPVVWTTTEELLVEIIEAQHPACLTKLVRENVETNNNILVYPSHLVRKATKKVLPGIHEAVQDDTHTEQLLFANGADTEFNLVNNKGRNDLKADSVILISYPHPKVVNALTLTLGLGPEHRDAVMRKLIVDQLNQAAGRSQGYRGSHHRCLVVCDPRLEVSLRNNCRYRLNTLDGLNRRGRLKGSPLVWATEQPSWWAQWISYLLTWQRYVVVIGERVFETFTMKRLGLATDEQKLIERRMKKPLPFAHLIWQKRNEVAEGEDGRRNYTLLLHELVSEFNKSQQPAATRQVGSANKGLRLYYSPDGTQKKRYVPGNEPAGWTRRVRKYRQLT